MPVTELAALQLFPPHEFHSPHISNLFQSISTSQSAVSGFPLYFFEDVTDKSIIYLISGWIDVDAHMKWIKGDVNQELLRISTPYLKVLRLYHLDVDFVGTLVQRDVIMVTMMKSRGEPANKLDFMRETPIWTGVGIDLESGTEGMKYEIFVYDTHNTTAVPHTQAEGSDRAIIMSRLVLTRNDRPISKLTR